MTLWFLRDSERLTRERKGIEELSRSAKWLIGAEWRLDGGLCLDAVIRAHDHDYEIRISFPALYPDAPAVVRPLNMSERISTHQYGGADGPLCLEWGPDNWHRGVTAVQMLESCYKLFDTENPLGSDRPTIPVSAPSRHALSIGQNLRGEWARWYESGGLTDFLAAQPHKSVGALKFSFSKNGENWHALIHEAALIGGTVWKDEQIPKTLAGADPNSLGVGIWFKTDLDPGSIGQPKNLVELQALLSPMDGGTYLASDGTSPIEGFKRPIAAVLIVDQSGGAHFFIVLSGQDAFSCVKVSSERDATETRAPEAQVLKGKAVGIVGLGSAGSKIAVSLARMGVRKFCLVDHDVLLPENLRRHALDWQGILQHKVEAMLAALERVSAGIEVQTSRLHLTGQESNAAVSGALNRLAECDLIIDATADSRVFNLLGAIARTAARPMVWLEIFGGGIGGMVARSRPRVDPVPQDMRAAYLQFSTEHPDLTISENATDYAVEMQDGKVLMASDADVSVIAHHAARFVPDCFLKPEESRFPYSMYLIGLAKGWVFEAPFATIPISMASYSTSAANPENISELSADNATFLLDLIEKPKNATTTSTSDRGTTD